MAGAVNRRQQQWETQLEDSVFLKGAIKPIVDDTTALKPPVPYALRQALKHMNKTIYFQDNGYGGGGAARWPLSREETAQRRDDVRVMS